MNGSTGRAREPGAGSAIEAVIFDWGGTLTPWRTMDYREESRALASDHADDRLVAVTEAIFAAGGAIWGRARDEHRSATLSELCALAGVEPTPSALAAYRAYWEPATLTDPTVRPLWTSLRGRGVKVGVLSNTIWPRAWHEEFFARDGVLDLVDGTVYTSEIAWTKPHPGAFHAAMAAVGVEEPSACVYVGDRLFEDVWGPAQLGMRTIWVPHSEIPAEQLGHSEGVPDAVVNSLSEVLDVVAGW
ncbi:MAG: HAD family hydrolase [Nocardioidaceae bacterium]